MTSSTLQTLTGAAFAFSAERIENLGATEYTLVTLAVDDSGSVSPFRDELEKTVQAVVAACRKSPRADNLLLRLVTFSTNVQEVHGYRELAHCNDNDYVGFLRCSGLTALCDATVDGAESISVYGGNLDANDLDANAILIVITDGQENHSTHTEAQAKQKLADSVQSEVLESVRAILVGVDTSGSVGAALDAFRQSVGFDQYVGIGDATASKLARLAEFISKSISAQSTALGTGGPSKSLTF